MNEVKKIGHMVKSSRRNKVRVDDNSKIFLSNLHKNLCFGCSLESPRRGDSNEYPQHRFL